MGKRGAEDLGPTLGEIPQFRRFPGIGRKLPDEGFRPFTGQAQRLPDEHGVRAAAIQRMRELAEQGQQRQWAVEIQARQNDLRRPTWSG